MQEENIFFIENHLIYCIQRILSPSLSVDISLAEEQLVEYQRKYFILNNLWVKIFPCSSFYFSLNAE